MVRNKDKIFSNIFYITTLTITVCLFIFFILNLFKVFKVYVAIPYYLIFILLIVSALINLFIIILEKKRKIYIASLIKMLIFITVIVYIAVYPAFGLYKKIEFIYVYQIFASLVFCIIGVSIFYNNMKTKENIVKVKQTFVILFSFCFSVCLSIVIEVLKNALIVIAKGVMDTKIFVVDVLLAVALSVLYNCVFYVSLKGNKNIINYCIIEKL